MSYRSAKDGRRIAVALGLGATLLGGCYSEPPALNLADTETSSTSGSSTAATETPSGSETSETTSDQGTSSTTEASTTDAPETETEAASTDTTATSTDSGSETESSGADTGTGSDTGASGNDTGDPNGAPECDVDGDCQLVNDCCNCIAIPIDEAAPNCELDCVISSCASQGMPDVTAACLNRQCVLSNAF